MALELYSAPFWYPNGALAVNIAAQVFPFDNNLFAPLFADAAGTIPISNPTSTDAFGVLTFYAEAGQYWVHLDTETFLVDVGLGQEQADLSTGVSSGGDISPAVNPQAVTIAPLTGYIVDNSNEFPVPPVIKYINFPGGVFPLVGASLTRTITYWLMDATQTVIQQATKPTPDQYRQFLVLGVSAFDTVSGTILEAQTLPTILAQPANQLVDLMESLGPFSVSGNEITANGANLMLDKTAGEVFARAFNYVSGGMVTDNPHLSVSPASVGLQLRRIVQTALVPTPPAVTTIDPANYDVGGVITPIPGPPTVSTVQRIYLFAANTASLRIAVQYGQALYATPATAVASIGAGRQFMPAPVTQLGALIGYLAVTKSASDLSDPAQATFVYARKFSTP